MGVCDVSSEELGAGFAELRRCEMLVALDLSYNRLNDAIGVVNAVQLHTPHLQRLSLMGNPMCKIEYVLALPRPFLLVANSLLPIAVVTVRW